MTGVFRWSDADVEAFRRARADAELVASAATVREFLADIDTVPPPGPEVAGSDQLVFAYRPLVVKLAKAHTGRGTAFLDLIESGMVALTLAAERFDPAAGQSFSDFATGWILRAFYD